MNETRLARQEHRHRPSERSSSQRSLHRSSPSSCTSSYQLESTNSVDFNRIQLIIQRCVLNEVMDSMPIYNPPEVMNFVKNVSDNIRLAIKFRNLCMRYRTVVIVNVTEKAHQGINWRVGSLFDSTRDDWTSFKYETTSYIVNVFVAWVHFE